MFAGYWQLRDTSLQNQMKKLHHHIPFRCSVLQNRCWNLCPLSSLRQLILGKSSYVNIQTRVYFAIIVKLRSTNEKTTRQWSMKHANLMTDLLTWHFVLTNLSSQCSDNTGHAIIAWLRTVFDSAKTYFIANIYRQITWHLIYLGSNSINDLDILCLASCWGRPTLSIHLGSRHFA